MADAVNVFPAGFRLTDATGAAIAGAYAEFYDAGPTTTPKTVYADRDLTTSLGATVYTDAGGYPIVAQGSASKTLVYTDTAPYKVILYDGSGTAYATHDDVVGAVVSGTVSGSDGITEEEADARYVRNPVALTASTNIADTDYLSFWATSLSANRGILWSAFKADLLGEWQATGTLIPTGTRCPFQQTTPPTGYTKETSASYNDAVSKFTTGTASTGGSQSFATTFANRTFTGTVGNTSLTTAQLADHDHLAVRNTASAGAALSGANYLAVSDVLSGFPQDYTLKGTAAGAPNVGLTSGTGSGNAHAHSLVMDAAQFSVKYVEMTIGVKT